VVGVYARGNRCVRVGVCEGGGVGVWGASTLTAAAPTAPPETYLVRQLGAKGLECWHSELHLDLLKHTVDSVSDDDLDVRRLQHAHLSLVLHSRSDRTQEPHAVMACTCTQHGGKRKA
jgi:hypothetical protein